MSIDHAVKFRKSVLVLWFKFGRFHTPQIENKRKWNIECFDQKRVMMTIIIIVTDLIRMVPKQQQKMGNWRLEE